MMTIKKRQVKSIKDLCKSNEWIEKLEKSTKYVTTEHQSFGLMMAEKLGDRKRIPMYIKLAKEEYRPILEMAISFVYDYPKAKNKPALFMWKLKTLRKEREEREKNREQLNNDSQLTITN